MDCTSHACISHAFGLSSLYQGLWDSNSHLFRSLYVPSFYSMDCPTPLISERISNNRNVTVPVRPTRYPVCGHKLSGFTEGVY